MSWKRLFVALSILGVQWSDPAIATNLSDCDCVASKLPPDFFIAATDLETKPDADDRMKKMLERMDAPVGECLAEFHFPEGASQTLKTYTLGKLGANYYARILSSRGLPHDAIDVALEIGPRRKNPVRNSLTLVDVRAISAELARRGVNVRHATNQTWLLIAKYSAWATMQSLSGKALGI